MGIEEIDSMLNCTNELEWYDCDLLTQCQEFLIRLGKEERNALLSLGPSRSDLWKVHLVESLETINSLDAKPFVLQMLRTASNEHLIITCLLFFERKTGILSKNDKQYLRQIIQELSKKARTINKKLLGDLFSVFDPS